MAKMADSTSRLRLTGGLQAAMNLEATTPFASSSKKLAEAVEAVDRARCTPSPLKTSAQHWQEIGRQSQRALNHAKKEKAKLENYFSSEYSKLFIKKMESLGLDEEPKNAAEVRQALREMPDRQRFKVLADASKRKDTQIMGSVLMGSPYLSGLNPDDHARVQREYEKSHASEIIAQTEKLEADFEFFKRTVSEAKHLFGLMVDAEELERAEASSRQNQAALDAVNESLSKINEQTLVSQQGAPS